MLIRFIFFLCNKFVYFISNPLIYRNFYCSVTLDTVLFLFMLAYSFLIFILMSISFVAWFLSHFSLGLYLNAYNSNHFSVIKIICVVICSLYLVIKAFSSCPLDSLWMYFLFSFLLYSHSHSRNFKSSSGYIWELSFLFKVHILLPLVSKGVA